MPSLIHYDDVGRFLRIRARGKVGFCTGAKGDPGCYEIDMNLEEAAETAVWLLEQIAKRDPDVAEAAVERMDERVDASMRFWSKVTRG